MADPERGDIFRPSLQGHDSVGRLPQERPWRLYSQFFVAFFGGVLAVTAIAYLNGKRLGLSDARLRVIIVLGVLTLLISLAALSYVLGSAELNRESRFAISTRP